MIPDFWHVSTSLWSAKRHLSPRSCDLCNPFKVLDIFCVDHGLETLLFSSWRGSVKSLNHIIEYFCSLTGLYAIKYFYESACSTRINAGYCVLQKWREFRLLSILYYRSVCFFALIPKLLFHRCLNNIFLFAIIPLSMLQNRCHWKLEHFWN